MMSIQCSDIRCKYHSGGKCTFNGEIKISGSGCDSFERGIYYYFNLVWQKLAHKNFIDVAELTDELRIGMYYVMSVFHLGMAEMEWGTCRFIMLQQAENGSALNYEEIVSLPVDMEILEQIYQEHNSGVLPDLCKKQIVLKKSVQPFGWLSPKGEFIKGDFGKHEETALKIIQNNCFEAEYHQYLFNKKGTARDFLSEVKGYCLIHNPIGDGGYVVSHTKSLTKRQREFLYDYFNDIGDQFKAKQYL